MANQIPLSGATNAAGGYLLPPEQGEILVNGILVETGAIQIAGDARSTTARKTNFPIWLGRPTAGPVGEGEKKGVTGASFGQSTLNVKKFASLILFTDEQIEDLQNGDLSVLADAGVRQALSVSIDAHASGATAGVQIAKPGSVFDSPLLQQEAPGVIIESTEKTGIQKAVSAAMGVLEENGYGNPDDMGVLLGFGFQKLLRDARDVNERPLYDGGSYAGQVIDALYGLDRAHSTNLPTVSAANTLEATLKTKTATITSRGTAFLCVGQPISGTGIPANTTITSLTGEPGEETAIVLSNAVTEEGKEVLTVKRPVGLVAHKPNIHVRVRQDVILKHSSEATVEVEGKNLSLFQENLTGVLYETRIGYLVHDAKRALVPLYL
jgi:Phage capsid family